MERRHIKGMLYLILALISLIVAIHGIVSVVQRNSGQPCQQVKQ